jgi:hypothetical protein
MKAIDSPQPDIKLFDYIARCDFPCMFPGHCLSGPAPLSQIQDDPEGFRHIQIRFPGLAYMRFSYPLLVRVIFNIAESPDDVADNPGTLREPILALSGAPDCEVFMATSGSAKIEV